MDIANLNYVPTLAIRASEMNGLERLPAPTKDRIQPVFLLAPWPNATDLMKAVDRIQKAFPSRPFFLDIDWDYEVTNPEVPAQVQWLELRDPANDYANWIGFIEGVAHASPCLQVAGLTAPQITNQILAFQEMGRSFAVRVELHRFPENIQDIVAAVNMVGSADYAILIDAGWVNDTLTTRATISGIIQNTFGDLDAQVPIVVSYTTIPKGFAEVEGTDFVEFDNRSLIEELKVSTNRQRIVYGDWGSTRPREKGIASRPKPRIDLPLRNGWLSARNRPEEWDFEDAAEEIMGSDYWLQVDGMGIWGEFMIRQTAVNPAVGINTPQKNIASRVNIHLHTQAFYNEPNITGLNLDEKWED